MFDCYNLVINTYIEMNSIWENLNDFFDGNIYFNVFNLLIAIISIVSSVFFYIKSKKNKKPTYILRTVNLIREKIQKIDRVNVLFDGNTVKNLSITKIAFWNDGKDTIDKADVSKKNPIRLTIKDDYIFLETEIIYQKNLSNDFKVSISDDHKYIDIDFDYFDFEEGIVLQVFHTGNKSTDISIIGQIKSVKRIQRKDNTHSFLPSFIVVFFRKISISSRKIKNIVDWTILIIGLFSILMSIYLSFSKTELIMESDPESDRISLIVSFVVIGLLYFYMGCSSLKRNIPKGFDIFNEEFLKEKNNDPE